VSSDDLCNNSECEEWTRSEDTNAQEM
jgi:hypothetical protein